MEDCRHIQEARKLLCLLLMRSTMEGLEEAFEGCSVPARICECRLCVDPNVRLLCKFLVSKSYDDDQDRSISHLPILPPTWVSLPSDPNLYDCAPPVKEVPEFIALDLNSRCLCKMGYDSLHPMTSKPCIVYTLSTAHTATIELQSCVNCAPHRRSIGPDGRSVGLFNLNNNILFSHDLLDEYTSAFTSSETPFAAWVTTLQRHYDLHQSQLRFVAARTFRSAWFAYTRLQHFEGDMLCPRCGPSPEDVIWDGVTLAFGKRHLLDSIQPPTTTSDLHSPLRSTICYYPQQQLIESKVLRKQIRLVLKGPMVFEDEVPPNSEASSKQVAGATAMLQHIHLVDQVTAELGAVNKGAAKIWSVHFGVQKVVAKYRAPANVHRLMEQVKPVYYYGKSNS
jgi:CxC4 like cysteine cluster associated with KDZ transposases